MCDEINNISHMDVMDWLVSDHDDCDFDEFCVLDNDTKKKKVKKHRELTLVSLCF